jgi:peptidyl-prolyl cis-trans isomerase C
MSCTLHEALPEPKVVSVNGTVIPREAIAQEVQYHPAPKPILAWQAAARALVVRELLLQEARRLGAVAEPITDEAGRRETDEEALVRGLIERQVKTPRPDAETCRRYYEQNRKQFRSATIYEAAHILFAARQDRVDEFAEARVAAEAVLGELSQHPERFGDIARAHSACPSAAMGGNLGQITTGQTTPEFEEALIALRDGEITAKPVVTRYGFHVIRLDRKIDGRDLPFETVAERIAGYLAEAVTRRATAQYIARLVSNSEIAGIALAGAEAHRVN